MSANLPSPIPPLSQTTAMTAMPPSTRLKPVDPLRVIRQYLLWLVLLLVVGVVAGVGTWFLLDTYRPQYTSGLLLRVRPQVVDPMRVSSGDLQPGGGHREAVEQFIQNEIMRLLSEETLRETVNRTPVQNTRWFQNFDDDVALAREALADHHLKVGPIRGTTLINVRITTSDPEDAPQILRSLTEVYMHMVREEYEQRHTDLGGLFRREQENWDSQIETLEREVREFLVREDVSTLDARRSEASISYEQLAQRHVELSLLLDQLEGSYETQLQAQQEGNPEPTSEMLVEIQSQPGIARLDDELRLYRRERDRLSARFGADHHRIQDLDNQVLATEAEKQRESDRLIRELLAARLERVAGEVGAVQAQIAALQPRLRAAEARLTDLNDRLTRYRQLETQLTHAREKRDELDSVLRDHRVLSDRTDAIPVRPQGGPTTAEKTFPLRTLTIVGVALAVMGAGTGLIFLREMLDQRVRSPMDVKMVAEAELLGIVPDAGEDPTGPGRVEGVVATDPTGLMAESFRQVRTAILIKMDRRGYKTLVVASAQPGAGTSTITQNLAASLALNGRKVLVIDANFRRPTQHRLAGVGNAKGLVDVLRGRAKLDEAIAATDEPNLAILPTGDAQGAAPELLDGPGLRTLLSQAEREYDLILIDAPPALLATDTQLLAKHVDALALVLRAGRDKRGMVDRMLRQLDGQRADVLGLVLNGIRSSAGGYLARSYQEFYRYRSNGANGNGNGAGTPKRLTADPAEPAGR